MKRKLADEGSQGQAKKLLVETHAFPDQSDAQVGWEDDHSVFSTSRRTSVSYDGLPNLADTPVTEPSTISRQSRKFPSDLKTIACPYTDCPKTFNRPARLAAHLRSHTNDRPFRCRYDGCDKAYLEEKHLKQHVKGSHTQDRKYVCTEPGCGASFTTGTRLRRHADVHAGAERFRCRGYPPCDKTFRKHQTLQRHVRTDHLGQPAYMCETDGCRAGFDTAGALRRHMQRELGEMRFWCDECVGEETEDGGEGSARLGFSTMDQLKAHVRRSHISCLFCNTRCNSQGELERHVERYHSGTTLEDRKTVACTWDGCQKKFVKQSNLRMHVRTAHEGFRFVCGEIDLSKSDGLADWNEEEEGCREGFISKLKLEEHVRFVHLGNKRPRALVPVDSPIDHIEQISGASVAGQRITCSVFGCGATFLRYHDLSEHVNFIHNAELADGAMTSTLPGRMGLGQVQGESPDERRPYESSTFSHPVYGGASMNEDEFWMGGSSSRTQESEFATEWEEMRKLIDFEEPEQTL